MDYEEFLATITVRGGLETRDRAAAIARATVQTLAERLDEPTRLAAELPHELARYAVRPVDLGPDPFGVDEFVGRVAERADLPPPSALRLARVVVSELASATSPDRLGAICGTLPGEWRALLDAPPSADAAPVAPA